MHINNKSIEMRVEFVIIASDNDDTPESPMLFHINFKTITTIIVQLTTTSHSSSNK